MKPQIFLILLLVTGCCTERITVKECIEKYPPINIDKSFVIVDTVYTNRVITEFAIPLNSNVFSDTLTPIFRNDSIEVKAKINSSKGLIELKAEYFPIKVRVNTADTTAFMVLIRKLQKENNTLKYNLEKEKENSSNYKEKATRYDTFKFSVIGVISFIIIMLLGVVGIKILK